MKIIPLTQGKFTLVDDQDFDWLNQWRWHLSGGYALHRQGNSRNPESKIVPLHRLIIETPEGMDTDHINGDKLDNRRQNLRICSHSENMANQKIRKGTSKFKGVFWSKSHNRWRARIKSNYKMYHIGLFDEEQDAAIAYDLWAKDLFGKFARLNFI